MPLTKKQLLILLATTFAAKLALGSYFSHLTTCEVPEMRLGYIAVYDGDTFSYLGAMDNLLQQGKYFFWNGARDVYAGRMPYYGAPYFLLRLFLDKSAAYDVIVVFQIFFDALATVVFARLCFSLTPRKSVFWLGFLIYFGSFNAFIWSVILNTESLSISFPVFFLYFLHLFWTKGKWSNAFAAAVFLALMTVLKPYLVLLYPAFFLGVLLKDGKIENLSAVKSAVRRLFILSLPLLILLTPWIVRNAIVLNRFIPAQENIYAGYNYSKAFLALDAFAGAWGGALGAWDVSDAGCYFTENPPSGCRFVMPQYALTDEYNAGDIERIRQNYLKLQTDYSPELEQNVVAELKNFTEIYKREKPLMYHVGSKFIIVKKMFWHTNNAIVPIQPNFKCYASYQIIFKVIQFIIYVFALSFGIFGVIKLAYEGKISLSMLIFPVTIIVLLAELRTTQARYIGQIYVIFLIGIPATFVTSISMLKIWLNKSR